MRVNQGTDVYSNKVWTFNTFWDSFTRLPQLKPNLASNLESFCQFPGPDKTIDLSMFLLFWFVCFGVFLFACFVFLRQDFSLALEPVLEFLL